VLAKSEQRFHRGARSSGRAGARLISAVTASWCLVACSGSSPGTPVVPVRATSVPSVTSMPVPTATALDLRPRVGNAKPPSKIRGFRLRAPSQRAVHDAAVVAARYQQVSSGRAVQAVSPKAGPATTGGIAVLVIDVKPEFSENTVFQAQLANSVVKDLAGRSSKITNETFGERNVRVGKGRTAAVMGWYDPTRGAVVAVLSYRHDVKQVRKIVARYPRN